MIDKSSGFGGVGGGGKEAVIAGVNGGQRKAEATVSVSINSIRGERKSIGG